ncbi:MAG TPA: hypothetical protein VIG72_04775 [Pontibacter sp.]
MVPVCNWPSARTEKDGLQEAIVVRAIVVIITMARVSSFVSAIVGPPAQLDHRSSPARKLQVAEL